MHQIYHSKIYQKDGAPVESIFLLYKSMPPNPAALCAIVVKNVVLLLRKGVLGSTDPAHSPIF